MQPTSASNCWGSQPAMRTLLYYPTFLPPSTAWVKQCLLYWDDFATIIPDSLYDRVSTHELDYLRSEGVYRPVSPHFYKPGLGQLGEGIEKRLGKALSKKAMKATLAATDPADTYPVSNLKMTPGVLDVLEANGLIVRTRGWVDDYDLKRPAALLYMSLLADGMARFADKEPMQPGTDSQYAQSVAFEQGRSKGLRLVLNAALPTVREDVPYDDLLRFRNTRRHELLRFRAFIDKAEDSLASEDAADFARQLERFKEQLEREIRDLQQLMDDGRIAWGHGTLETLVGASSPGILSGLLTLGVTSNPHLALASGGAIALGKALLSKRKIRRETEKSPVSYLFAAVEELG